MKSFKSVTMIIIAALFTVGCSSGEHDSKADQHTSDSTGTDTAALNTMRTGNGPGTGTGSSSGTNTGTPGTGTGPGVNSDTGSLIGDVPNGTGTVTKKADTGVKKGKWPTQGDPMN